MESLWKTLTTPSIFRTSTPFHPSFSFLFCTYVNILSLMSPATILKLSCFSLPAASCSDATTAPVPVATSKMYSSPVNPATPAFCIMISAKGFVAFSARAYLVAMRSSFHWSLACCAIVSSPVEAAMVVMSMARIATLLVMKAMK
jgi:hypothetical protein